MFREMRLIDQQLDRAEVDKIMNSCTNGVLCLQGDNGYPYGVPVSYAYANEIRYFADCVFNNTPVKKVQPEELRCVLNILNNL